MELIMWKQNIQDDSGLTSNMKKTVSVFELSCKVGQRILNRENSHIGHNNYRCHDTSSGVLMAVQRMAAIRPLFPKPYRRLPRAQSNHCHDDAMSDEDSIRDIFSLKRVAGKNDVQMIASRIVETDHNDQ